MIFHFKKERLPPKLFDLPNKPIISTAIDQVSKNPTIPSGKPSNTMMIYCSTVIYLLIIWNRCLRCVKSIRTRSKGSAFIWNASIVHSACSATILMATSLGALWSSNQSRIRSFKRSSMRPSINISWISRRAKRKDWDWSKLNWRRRTLWI